MKRTPLAVLLLSLFTTLASAADAPSSAPASNKPTIFVCGDSTSKYSGGETPGHYRQDKAGHDMAGWGTPIAEYFDPDKVTVANVGHAGQSSMSYYERDWPSVVKKIQAGDFVLLVFGINDGGKSLDGIGNETKPGPNGAEAHTYGWYMAKMATDARDKGAAPILLTVTTRNIWSNPKAKFKDATPQGDLPADYDPKQDTIERGTSNGRYTQWTKDVAAKLHIPVFDLTNYCADLYESMGREDVNKLYSDHNHTYVAGAEIVAKSIVAGLKAIKDSPFVPLLSEKGKTVEPADKKYVADNQGNPK